MRVRMIVKPWSSMNGTARCSAELYRALRSRGVDARLAVPCPAPIPRVAAKGMRRLGLDAETFFQSYPVRVPRSPADVYHLTSQTLATLLCFQPFPAPVAVTVHDLLPSRTPRRDPLSPRQAADVACYRLALAGLRRADAIIASSEATKRTLMALPHIPNCRIHVAHLAIDHTLFWRRPVTDAFLGRYGLVADRRYLLYVGSDDPRKNLAALIGAFARVKRQCPDTALVLVGESCFPSERQRLEGLIRAAGLTGDVVQVGRVPDADLPSFYSLARLFVFPSLHEGFGLPVLEAMACGTRVVCSNRGPLPEIAGADSVLCEPTADRLAVAIGDCIARPDEPEAQQARRRWACRFDWSRTAGQVQAVYADLVGASTLGHRA